MSDNNYKSYADVDGVTIPVGTVIEPPNPLDYDDILKFSNARNVFAYDLTVAGGRENAIDLNRTCKNVLLHEVVTRGGRQAAFVIKGGSSAVTLMNVTIYPDPKAWCDILIGDWSDQSNERTRLVSLMNVRRIDGKPVRVVVGRADWPMIFGGDCRVMILESLALKAYWWGKFFLRKLHLA